MITINNLQHQLNPNHQLVINQLAIKPGDAWAFIGSNGSGKSALASLFSGQLILDDTSIVNQSFSGINTGRIAVVRFE